MLRLFQRMFSFMENNSSFIDVSQELSFVDENFPDSMRWEVGRMLGSLVLLLGIFGVGCWLFRRFLRSHGHIPNGNSSIKILDRRVLASKTSIYVIKVVNKILVIAERGDQVTLLSEFPPNTDLNELLKQNFQKAVAPRGEMLSGFLSQLKKKNKADNCL
ncbi:FliO/MopB family protein [Chlamydia sp.]|uniref:FliO/MopB family protein n=1 Tax=Chlamydia sp. TaxID=35827 RepID=UPI0025B88C7E|nr:FliO/MopB family protein [Chlamydia sp.]MBQ8498727.1 FliO/MopB family protein [Chlamydia sp.]